MVEMAIHTSILLITVVRHREPLSININQHEFIQQDNRNVTDMILRQLFLAAPQVSCRLRLIRHPRPMLRYHELPDLQLRIRDDPPRDARV